MRMLHAVSFSDQMNETFIGLDQVDILVAYPYKFGLPQVEATGWVQGVNGMLMLDSGAFSAWANGRPTDLEGFKEWAVERTALCSETVTVNLDVIPGEFGRDSTSEERAMGMVRSLDNGDYLRSAGLRVMEVFHQDEPEWFLDELMARRRPGELLGLSPRNDLSIASRTAWLGEVLRFMVQQGGKESIPPCRGLAVTARSMVSAFPFFSVDSSSWSAPARWGRQGIKGQRGRLSEVWAPHNEHRQMNWKDGPATFRAAMRLGILEMNALAAEVTKLWAGRGIVWTDDVLKEPISGSA